MKAFNRIVCFVQFQREAGGVLPGDRLNDSVKESCYVSGKL